MKPMKIKDICDKGSSNLKQKDIQGQGGKYPVYGASGIIGNINSFHQAKEYIAIVKDGSGIGRVSFMPAYSSVIGTLQYILPKKGFNIKYISYCLQSLNLSDFKQGAAIPHIYFRDYGEYVVNVEEDLSEQQHIVAYLDAEFAKTEALNANAEKQLQAAKDLFQAALKDLMTPKEGWVEKKLGEICEILDSKRKPITKSKRQFGEIPYYGATGLLDYVKDFIFDEKLVLLGEDGAKWGAGDISSYIINGKSWVNNHAHVLRPKRQYIIDEFLTSFLNFTDLSDFITGVTVPKLNQEKMRSIIVPLPSLSEQKQIAAKLDELCAKIKAFQTNYTETITLCNDLKQALLKQVFE